MLNIELLNVATYRLIEMSSDIFATRNLPNVEDRATSSSGYVAFDCHRGDR